MWPWPSSGPRGKRCSAEDSQSLLESRLGAEVAADDLRARTPERGHGLSVPAAALAVWAGPVPFPAFPATSAELKLFLCFTWRLEGFLVRNHLCLGWPEHRTVEEKLKGRVALPCLALPWWEEHGRQADRAQLVLLLPTPVHCAWSGKPVKSSVLAELRNYLQLFLLLHTKHQQWLKLKNNCPN